MKTLTELQQAMDRARAALYAYGMLDHNAYLTWPAADRIAFDVVHEKARIDYAAACDAYQAAVRRAAMHDPND